MRLISLGAGVQSSCLVILAAAGRLGRIDGAVFADTGWEPRRVYEHLDRLERQVAEPAGIPVYRVQSGNIRTQVLDPDRRFVSLPAYVRNADGSTGRATRQCTGELKLKPLKAAVRALLGAPPRANGVPGRVPRGRWAQMLIGFSTDEADRALGPDGLVNRGDVSYAVNAYPLLELGLSRRQCAAINTAAGFPDVPKSACVGCLIWNLITVGSSAVTVINWERFPLVGAHEQGRRWLQFMANIGRAPNTVDAYGWALEDHLLYLAGEGVDPVVARADVVAGWIGDLHERPNPRGAALVHMSSGTGLANSTIQQRLVAVRSFYEFLVEDGLRDRNPVRRGQSGRRGRRPRQGLVRRVQQAPWIPNEWQWARILEAARAEPLRNRLMLSLAYDGALRREELVSLDVGDFEPAHGLIHLRAVTTKSKRSREVSFGDASSQLLMAYLVQRREQFGRRPDGPLLLSMSRRNAGAGVGFSTWSKAVNGLAVRAQVPRLSTHTFRHLRLTDLARAEWTIDQIAQYAGHKDLATTMQYIHLSGRELAAKLHRASAGIARDRERLLAQLAGQL